MERTGNSETIGKQKGINPAQIDAKIQDKGLINQKQKLQQKKVEWEYNAPDRKPWQITASMDDFKKLYQSIKKNKEQENKSQADSLEKQRMKKKMKEKNGDKKKEEQKERIKNKQSEKGGKAKQDNQKKQIMEKLQNEILTFKSNHIHNLSKSELDQIRCQLLLNTFKNLLYGIHQLRQLNPKQLTETQKVIANLKFREPYAMARNITLSIDIKLFITLNASNTHNVSRKYKSFIKCFVKNIGDQSPHLRRKILSRKITPAQLATLNQEELYSPQIQQKLADHKNYLILSSTVAPKQFAQASEQKLNQQERKQDEGEKKINVMSESMKEIYMQFEPTFLQIKRLLTDQGLQKMRNNFDFGLMASTQKKLLDHYNWVVGTQSMAH